MSGTDSMQAVPSAMTEAAKGIDDALGELRSINGDEQAPVGRGLSRLGPSLGRPTTGDDALSAALAEFLDRWEWGVRALVRQAGDISAKLAASGAEYQQAENSVVGLLKRVVFDATADPAADASGVAGMSWEQIQAAGAPDPSPGSFTRALDHAGATWTATAADVEANTAPGMVERALHGENPLQGQLDDVAGLSEILD